MKIHALFEDIKKQLQKAGLESPAFESSLLIEKFCGVPYQKARFCEDEAQNIQDVYSAVKKRISGYPLQYLLGEWEFYGRPFFVGEGVLIPRPDTEIVAEAALRAVKQIPCPAVFDLCAGSGCIGLTMALERPDSTVYAVEKSEKAFFYLQKNRERHRAENVTAVKGDIFAPDRLPLPEKADLIVCNPPYITDSAMKELQAEVTHEPSAALSGGADGLRFYRFISPEYKPRLRAGGALVFEIGCDQQAAVEEILKAEGFLQVSATPDYGGNPRAVMGIWPG